MRHQHEIPTSTPAWAKQRKAQTRQRPVPQQAPLSPDVQLQRALGNQAYGQFLQAKLTVGAPDDPYEREADRVAEQVMRMPEPALQRTCPCGGTCSRCREEAEERVQRKEASAQAPRVSSGLASRIEALQGGGQSLPASERAFFEPRFGQDFSRVRVHTGAEAAETARALSARAFTLGRNVIFGAGAYAPETETGKQLLAHELTHVVQTRRASPHFDSRNGVFQLSPSGSLAEREAAAIAHQATNGKAVTVSQTVSPVTVSRAEEEEETEEDSGVIDCLIGLVGGEFIENPGLCQIIVETVVGLIPYVDQVMDVRDLIAHIYYMAFRDQLRRIGRWIGLVFTLIGAIPEVGTVIKGISKVIRRYASAIMEGVGSILRRIIPALSEFGIDLARRADDLLNQLRRLLREKWEDVVIKARAAWDALLDWFKRQIDAIPNILIRFSSTLQRARDGINNVRRVSGKMIKRAFNRAREIFEQLLEEVQQRLGRGGRDRRPRVRPRQLTFTTHGTGTNLVSEAQAGGRQFQFNRGHGYREHRTGPATHPQRAGSPEEVETAIAYDVLQRLEAGANFRGRPARIADPGPSVRVNGVEIRYNVIELGSGEIRISDYIAR